MAETLDITSIPTKASAAIESTDTMVVMSPDGDVNQTPIFEAVAKANGENGCICLQTVKLEIPSAEVLTLNSSPKAFGLTVPAGFYVDIQSAQLRMVYSSSAYATNTTIELRAIGATGAQIEFGSAVLASASDIFNTLAKTPSTTDNVLSGADIEVFVTSGDPTAGDSDITIYMTYALIPV